MTKVWAPHAGSQTLFLACPVFECLLEGTRGGGKTAALLMSFAQYVGVGFGQAWRGVLFRETYPQLADVAAKSKAWFRLFWPAARFNESSYTWKFPDGEELLLRSGIKEDDYWDHHGSEYPWIGFEELTNWRSLTFYEMMHSCCRSAHPGMPRMKGPRPTLTGGATPRSRPGSRSARSTLAPSSATPTGGSGATCTRM